MKISNKLTWPLFVAMVMVALVGSTSTEVKAGDIEDAEKLFAQHCAVCHGADRGGYIAPGLVKEKLGFVSEAAIRSMINTGIYETLMPPWGGKLTTTEMRKLASLFKSTSKANLSWGLEDIKKSLKVYIAD